MKAMLMKMPVDLTMAESEKIGFDLVRSRAFDLVITDIQMPEHTGLELLEWIQRDVPIPVIAFHGERRRGCAGSFFFRQALLVCLPNPSIARASAPP